MNIVILTPYTLYELEKKIDNDKTQYIQNNIYTFLFSFFSHLEKKITGYFFSIQLNPDLVGTSLKLTYLND